MKHLGILLLSLALLTQCGTGTSITDSWKDDTVQPKTFKKIGVLAITGQPGNRRMAESTLVSALGENGLAAEPTYNIFPDKELKEGLSKEKILEGLKAAGVDAVLTTSLINVKEESHFEPGSEYYPPSYDFYGGFYSYYSRWNSVYDPGYYSQETDYIVEANLYTVEEEGLIWSAHTKTINPDNVSTAAGSIADTLVKQLKKDGVLVGL